MVYLVGGYKLTRDQVLQWCRPRGLDPPDGNVTLDVNDWLRTHNIAQTRLLSCTYHAETIYLVVTNRRIDRNATRDNFMPFAESENARRIKELVGLGDIEFVTVPNPYG